MTASRVRTDHDALAQIAQAFERQADQIRTTLNSLKQCQEVLANGDWIGQGATAFYAEMNSSLVPAVQRLAEALATAGATTKQISQILHTAEDEAAAVFRSDGAGSAGSGAGSGAGGSASSGSGSGGTTAANEAADRMMADLPAQARDIVKQSPTVVGQLEKLEQDGWTIETGPASGGSYSDRTSKRIVIAEGSSPESIAANLAHEGGHALYGKPPYHPPTPDTGMTRQEYVDVNVQESLRDEGNAQLNAAIARDEILQNGGADIGIPGTQTADYQKVYDDFKNRKITRPEAVERMANLMGNEKTSNTSENYRQYYGKPFEKFWDENVK